MSPDFKIKKKAMKVYHHSGEQFVKTDYCILPTDRVLVTRRQHTLWQLMLPFFLHARIALVHLVWGRTMLSLMSSTQRYGSQMCLGSSSETGNLTDNFFLLKLLSDTLCSSVQLLVIEIQYCNDNGFSP